MYNVDALEIPLLTQNIQQHRSALPLSLTVRGMAGVQCRIVDALKIPLLTQNIEKYRSTLPLSLAVRGPAGVQPGRPPSDGLDHKGVVGLDHAPARLRGDGVPLYEEI